MFGQKFSGNHFPVDLVILWVDGSDPAFAKSRQQWATCLGCGAAEANHEARFIQQDELRYVFRSVEQNLSWVSRVVLVTNGQVPSWLNLSHPKLRVLFHDEFMPAEVLPTFNSCAIEAALPLWEGLSEHFLLANDDMFVFRKTARKFFFPTVCQVNNYRNFSAVPLNYQASLYRKQLWSTYLLLKKERLSLSPEEFVHYEPHHNIDAYLKSICRKTWQTFLQPLTQTVQHRFRSPQDVSRYIFAAMSVLAGKGKWKKTYKIHHWKSSSCVFELGQNYAAGIQRFRPHLVCLNDSESASEVDRARLRKFLAQVFTHKSSYEQ